jgi:hypothetical protein
LIHAIGAREACGRPRGIPINWGSIVRHAAIVIGVAFAARFFDMRDLAQVLDHEEPLPHPARDQAQ